MGMGRLWHDGRIQNDRKKRRRARMTHNSTVSRNKCPDKQLAQSRHHDHEEESVHGTNAISHKADDGSTHRCGKIDNGHC